MPGHRKGELNRVKSCHELIYLIIQQPRSDIEIESLSFQIRSRLSFSNARGIITAAPEVAWVRSY